MENEALILLCLLLLIEPQAVQTEVRNYQVNIQGAGQGTYTQKITTLASGLTVVESKALTDFKVLVVHVHYDHTARETWFDNKLQSCRSTTNDNGKAMSASADIEGNYTYSSSYWFPPKHLDISRPVIIFDSGSGEAWQAKITKIEDQIAHYRIEGLYPCELWFDVRGRLVKRTMTKQNRLVTVTLIR